MLREQSVSELQYTEIEKRKTNAELQTHSQAGLSRRQWIHTYIRTHTDTSKQRGKQKKMKQQKKAIRDTTLYIFISNFYKGIY